MTQDCATRIADGAFAARGHRLDAERQLRPLATAEAHDLAVYCAGIDPYRRLGLGPRGLKGYLTRDDPALFRFAIETKSGLSGLVAIRSPWLRGPFLEMLALMPAARGQGLGRAVLDWVAAEALRLAPNLWTTVSNFNEDARAFYARVGFEEISELPGLIIPDASEILLRRRL